MALLPYEYLDSVVAIGEKTKNRKTSWIATGFLFGKFFKKIDDDRHDYQTVLVTNRHVVRHFVERNKSIKIRFNPEGNKPAKKFNLDLINKRGEKLWIEHPDKDIDVAILRVPVAKAREEGMKFHIFRSDKDVISVNEMKEKGVSEGDFIYGLGFPMGIVHPDRQYVIARSGSIARIKDLFENFSKNFCVDLFVFPGNSGGPIIIRPEITHVERTKHITYPYLIGIVASYMPYQDIAISVQTEKARVIFEENSGLAKVYPIDCVLELIEKIPAD